MLSRLARRLRRARRTHAGPHAGREVAELLSARLADRPMPVVALLAPPLPGFGEALSRVLPSAEIVELPSDARARHVLIARRGPFDAAVEAGEDVDVDRRGRFEDTFWSLAPGRPYVVPGGAAEASRARESLGSLLSDVTAGPGEPLRRRRRRSRRHIRLALANHVRHTVAGDHLVFSHDLPDVLLKVREEDADALLAGQEPTRHRVIDVIPAEDPPAGPAYREGPEPRTPRCDVPINRATLSLRDYRDVVVAAPQIVVDGRLLLPDTYRHNQARMLWHKALADVAPRYAVPRTPIGSDLPRLEGTFVHLDNEARGHFGHVLTETLSRIWTWERGLQVDPDARAIFGANRARPEIAEWELEFYEVCGIPRDRIVLVDIGRPVVVERLISGTPMWSQPDYVHPRIRDTWRRVGDALAATAPDRPDWPRRIFVSRRISKRACLNGEQVEAEFRDAGFDVVYPEDNSLGAQVALFRNAEVIAGYGGSGMFQSLFVPEPKHLIQVVSDAYGPRNEYLICAVAGHRLDRVVCRAEAYRGRKVMHAPFRYLPEREGPFLRELLSDLGSST